MKNDTTSARMAAQEKLNGMSPRQRNDEKRLQILTWTYRWGWTTAQIITDLLGLQRRGFAKQLVDRGLLKPITVAKSGGVKGVPSEVFVLTELGVNEVESMITLEYLDGYRQGYNEQQVRHDLIAQKIVLQLLEQGFDDYMAPSEITSLLKSKKEAKYPDAMVIREGVKTAIEVELSRKVGREWDTTRRLIARSLQDNVFDEILIVSNSEAILQKYETELKDDRRVEVWTRNSARQWKATSTIRLSGIEHKLMTKRIAL